MQSGKVQNIYGKVWHTLDAAPQHVKQERLNNWTTFLRQPEPTPYPIKWYDYDGSSKYYDAVGSIADENHFIILITDTTELIAKSRELENNTATYEHILNNIPLAIALLSSDQKILFANEYICNLINTPQTEVISSYPGEHFSKITISSIREMYEEVLRTKSAVNEYSVHIDEGPRKGTDWLLFMHPYFKGDDLQSTLFVAINRTERQKMAMEREELSRKLFETQKISAINRFAGGLAHELSNMLHPAGVYARALSETPDLPEKKKYLDLINQAIMRSGNIIKKTLSLSRDDSAPPLPVNLNSFLVEFNDYANSIAPKGIEYELLLPANDVWGLVDISDLRQVLLNLLVNASHAQSNQGSVLITLGSGSIPPRNMPVTATHEGAFAWIDVTDHGAGMAEKTKDSIFTPFFTTKSKGQGTGLGLSIVQSIVTNWGGVVSVDTKLNEGSTFRVWVPLSPAVQVGENEGE